MENSKKKLRLDEIKVDSFVTTARVNSTTVLAGNSGAICVSHIDGHCRGNTDWTACFCEDAATNTVPGCVGPDEPSKYQTCGVSCECPSQFVTCPESCYKSACPSPGPCQ